MTEQHQHRAAAAAGPTTSGRRTTTGPAMPRWVKVAAIAVGLLLLVVLLLQLTGIAGEHGPGMHSSLGAPLPQPVAAGG